MLLKQKIETHQYMKTVRVMHLISKGGLATRAFSRYLSYLFQDDYVAHSKSMPKKINESDAVIINAEDYSKVELNDIIGQCYEMNQKANLAIMNISHDDAMYELVLWPNLNGVFHQDCPEKKLIKGIEKIFERGVWMPRSYSDYIIQNLRKVRNLERKVETDLTKRELTVLKELKNGKTNSEIALALNLSQHTVKTHLYKAYKKINVKSRFEAQSWVQKFIS